MRTRQEHLQWCKQRALEYVDRNDINNAIASMLSDLRKHPELAEAAAIAPMLMLVIDRNSQDSVRNFITGFN